MPAAISKRIWIADDRPDGNLTPADEPRFVYGLFPPRKWRATSGQNAALPSEGTAAG